jgi:hypothetical protein
MHCVGLVAIDVVRLVAITPHQLLQLIAADPRQEGRIGDLVNADVLRGSTFILDPRSPHSDRLPLDPGRRASDNPRKRTGFRIGQGRIG